MHPCHTNIPKPSLYDIIAAIKHIINMSFLSVCKELWPSQLDIDHDGNFHDDDILEELEVLGKISNEDNYALYFTANCMQLISFKSLTRSAIFLLRGITLHAHYHTPS